MKQSKLLCIILSVLLVLGFFTACNTTSADTATVATDDLIGLDKASMEYAALWLRTVMPELSEPECFYLNDGSLRGWSLLSDHSVVDIFPGDNGEPMGQIRISFGQNISAKQRKQLKDLCLAVAEHYLAPDMASHVASVLDIGPIENESYRYDVYDRIYTRYDGEGNCEVCGFKDTGYYVFGVTLDMATGQPIHVSICPDIPSADPDLLACQERINSELAQAGYPLSVYFYEGRTAVVYTGSGEDIYTNDINRLEIDFSNGYRGIHASTVPGASEDARNVVSIIGSIIAQYGKNSFSAEFMEAFFDLRSVSDLYADGRFTNQYGTELLISNDSYSIKYSNEAYTKGVSYTQEANGRCEYSFWCHSSENASETAAPKYAKHILISDYIPQFLEKVPECLDLFQLEGKQIVRIMDPESGALVFQVHFHFRPGDNVIERISASCDAAYSSDARIDLWFREVTAAIVELCDIGFTAEDVLGMYEEPNGMLFGEGIVIGYMYHEDGVSFSIDFALEDPQ